MRERTWNEERAGPECYKKGRQKSRPSRYDATLSSWLRHGLVGRESPSLYTCCTSTDRAILQLEFAGNVTWTLSTVSCKLAALVLYQVIFKDPRFKRVVWAVMARGALTQSLELEVADDGRPVSVTIPRWSNVNPEGKWQVQPFGGTLGEFRRFGGFILPTRVDGGNYFGTADYFPFFRARVEEISFPQR